MPSFTLEPNQEAGESVEQLYHRPHWGLRATIIALFLIVGVSVAGCFSAFLRYDLIGTGHFPRAALWPLLMLVTLNGVALWLTKRFWFTRGELLFLYCSLLVMSAIPGQQFATYFYIMLVGPVYHSTPQNNYDQLFLNYFPAWAMPSVDRDANVVRWAFEGMPKDAGWDWWIFKNIPPGEIWWAWLRPIILWTPFLLAIFFVTICIAAILRKQWVERERLLFPLAEIPLALTGATGSERRDEKPLFRNKIFWVCFAIPCVIYTVKALDFYPYFENSGWHRLFQVFDPMKPTTGNLIGERPWNAGLNWVELKVYFDMVGITYLLSTEMGFSLWFFYALRRLHAVAYSALGLENSTGVTEQMGFGAIAFLAVFYLWTMRGHLRDVIRKAITNDPEVDDTAEPISYRFAVFGSLGGMILIVGFCWMLGMSFLVAVALFAAYFLALIVLTRIVSEAGLFVFWLPAPQMWVMDGGSAANLSDKNHALLQWVGWKIQDSSSNIMPNALQAFKVAGETKMDNRRLFFYLCAAIAIGIFACHIPSIYVFYNTTIPQLGGWMKDSPVLLNDGILDRVLHDPGWRPDEWATLGAGATGCGLLAYCSQKFLWWPFHPLGFAASFGTGWGNRFGFSVFLGWLLKVIVLKVGGPRLWRGLRPAAFGLVLGNCFILFTWLLLQLVWSPGDKLLVIE